MGKINQFDQEEAVPEPIKLIFDIESENNQIQKDPHPGDLCQFCRAGHLDYDGLLNLVCQQCGYTFGGCST